MVRYPRERFFQFFFVYRVLRETLHRNLTRLQAPGRVLNKLIESRIKYSFTGLPYPWIIGVAIGVPVFIMIVLFLAIWLQELGWI
jgi:hypothetical protein